MGKLTDILLLTVLLGGLLLFVGYPIYCILQRSVHSADGPTLDAYRAVWNQYGTSFRHSLFVAVCGAVSSTVFSVAAALCIASSKGWRRKLLMGIVMVAMVSPPFVSSLAYIQLYGRRGWITYRLLGLSWNPYNKWGILRCPFLC